jgi:riboflavin synthase
VFTGIVESVGAVVALEPREGCTRLVLEEPRIAGGVGLGDSVSVNGACLTVAAVSGPRVSFDAVRETLERTALGRLREGSRVNLERAMRADARLDGHIVQGHVDDTGRVRELRRRAADVQLFVDCDSDFAGWLVEKGSVAIDGVSLTVVGVESAGFDVALIPHTLEVTTLGSLEPGTPVNLEADVLGKYVKRYLDRILPGTPDGTGAGERRPR